LGKALLGLCIGAEVRAERFVVADLDMLSATESSMRSVRGRHVSMIWQDPLATLDPLQRIGNALVESVRTHYDMSREDARNSAHQALERAGLDGARASMHAFAHQLSGGQRQRVGIALAIVTKPSLLVADEPTSSLDPVLAQTVAGVLRKVAVDEGCGLLLVTHDFDVARAVADEAIVMHEGRVVEHGPIDAMWSAPRSQATRDLLAAAAVQMPGVGV